MTRIAPVLVAALILVSVGHTKTQKSGEVTLTKIHDAKPQQIGTTPGLALADTCLVYHGGEVIWRIDGWVFGNELYKAYLDPAQLCSGGYPFEVWEIHLLMAFDAPTPLDISVDIEAADMSSPGCPVPGSLLVISSEYQTQVPDSGLYDVGVPLDAPYVIDGPFFAGFFISNALDQSVGAAVTTDSIPVPCKTYNIWDDSIGFVDLSNNQFYNFPGRMVMFANGTSVGSPSCCLTRGNVNGSGSVDISDLTYMVAFMFGGGPDPVCPEEADINGSGAFPPDISDLTFMVAYMFGGGPQPVACQ